MADVEAVYHSLLASLDELSNYEERRVLVLNLVKYITLTETSNGIAIDPTNHAILREKLVDLCQDFALQVIGLPLFYDEAMANEPPCGLCPACVEAGVAPPEPVSADVSTDVSVN